MTEDQALQIMGALLDGFRPQDWSVGSTRVYVQSLKDLDYDATWVAAARLLQTGRFMPRVSEIRGEVQRVLNPDALTAGEAWTLVLREISRVGTLGTPEWGDPTVKAAVDAVGWRSICQSDTPGVERAHFTKAYDALLERKVTSDKVAPFLHEAAAALKERGTKALEAGQ